MLASTAYHAISRTATPLTVPICSCPVPRYPLDHTQPQTLPPSSAIQPADPPHDQIGRCRHRRRAGVKPLVRFVQLGEEVVYV